MQKISLVAPPSIPEAPPLFRGWVRPCLKELVLLPNVIIACKIYDCQEVRTILFIFNIRTNLQFTPNTTFSRTMLGEARYHVYRLWNLKHNKSLHYKKAISISFLFISLSISTSLGRVILQQDVSFQGALYLHYIQCV